MLVLYGIHDQTNQTMSGGKQMRERQIEVPLHLCKMLDVQL